MLKSIFGSGKAPNQTLWLEDGDLIIRVVKDDATWLHRVHSGTLRLHSEVFRDMSVVAGPVPGQDVLHSCPVVQLYDGPKDVWNLLKVLHYPGTLPHQQLRQKTFDELEPVLRLADKYQMHDLVDRHRPTLEQDWPSTLHQWDRNETEIRLLHEFLMDRSSNLSSEGFTRSDYLDTILPEPCRVIRLARQCNITSILPAAFYHLSRLDLNNDPRGNVAALRRGARRAEREYLTAEDWHALYRGMVGIRKWCSSVIDGIPQHVPTNPNQLSYRSSAAASCPQVLQRIAQEMEKGIFETGDDGRLSIDPLTSLKRDYVAEVRTVQTQNLCLECQTRVKAWILERRGQFWTLLPSFFHLPHWPAGGSTRPDRDGI